MMRFPIEIELVMAGSVMRSMQLVSPITILLMKELYVPSMCQVILDPMHPKRSILLISFDYLPDLINEFLI